MPVASELDASVESAEPVVSSLVAPPAVRVENLSIRFRTVHEHLSTSLKHALRTLHHRNKSKAMVEALQDVSFEVARGSVYGVIGSNGAGKSTLFRALAGVLPPDGGRIEVYGRVTPLLSLGVGFNRELTGRENILLGGLAAGLDRPEIAHHTDDILQFADLGDAIDRPMRTYSSGMFGRLGFAIAAHLDPEIILIDEALSAGDAAFKARCAEKLASLCENDCTVLVVTHGMGFVRKAADRCLWLDHGRVMDEGPAKEIIAAYVESQGSPDEATTDLDI